MVHKDCCCRERDRQSQTAEHTAPQTPLLLTREVIGHVALPPVLEITRAQGKTFRCRTYVGGGGGGIAPLSFPWPLVVERDAQAHRATYRGACTARRTDCRLVVAWPVPHRCKCPWLLRSRSGRTRASARSAGRTTAMRSTPWNHLVFVLLFTS